MEAVDFASNSEEEDLTAVVSGWASANPSDAIKFMDELPEGMVGKRDQIATSIAAGLADLDTEMATDFVFRMAETGEANPRRLMEIVAEKTLRLGSISEAATWSSLLPDGDLKGAAMNRVAQSYARKNPEKAARWVEDFADKDYAAGAIERIGNNWGRIDPTAAVDWLEELPEGRGAVVGLRSVYGDWEDKDPIAASERLLTMPQSEKRDFAISGFSRGYAWQDPSAAITWAQDISDPALRQETLTQAGRAFYRRQPEEARTWLETSGLPEESIRQILENRR